MVRPRCTGFRGKPPFKAKHGADFAFRKEATQPFHGIHIAVIENAENGVIRVRCRVEGGSVHVPKKSH